MLREKYLLFKFRHVGLDCTWTNWLLERMKKYPIFSTARRFKLTKFADRDLADARELNKQRKLGGILRAENAKSIYEEFGITHKAKEATDVCLQAYGVASEIYYDASLKAALDKQSKLAARYLKNVMFLDKRGRNPEIVSNPEMSRIL